MAAANRSGRSVMARPTKMPPALLPWMASLAADVYRWAINHSAHAIPKSGRPELTAPHFAFMSTQGLLMLIDAPAWVAKAALSLLGSPKSESCLSLR